MIDPGGTFGARYSALTSVEERAALEAAAGRREQFVLVDVVLDRLISTAMRGDRIAKLVSTMAMKGGDGVELEVPLSDEERDAITEHFEVSHQEKRGAWYVPEGEPLSLGLMHTVHWTRRVPRMALNLADSERATPEFRGAPEAVAVWVLEPLFEELFLPLKVRGLYWLGKKTVEQQEKYWAAIDPLYSALGLDPEPLNAYRPGTGWSRLTTDDVIARRRALVESWARAPDDVGARYRAYRLGQVIDRYYKKAKNGQARRKGVLTKPAGRTLTAYFGGGWLDFLAYIGEEPHQAEEIVQALPKTKLMVGDSQRAAQVAAEHGLPAEEVERMLAAYWQQPHHSSPVEQRVTALRRFWAEFDALHARQESGMDPLWGLVQEHSYVHPLEAERTEGGTHEARLYERLFSTDLQGDIVNLWGTALLPRWPDRLVTEPAPHARLAEAFGPALRFWEGAALTAWFLCEGPYSRTDMNGLENYHHRELDALTELDCPVEDELFRELRDAEKRLTPVEPEYDEVSEHDVGYGLSISVGVSMGPQKLQGFEALRDIVTRHRRAWSERYLDGYLRARWEADLRSVGEAYHRHAADKSKPPTVKQFAKVAAPACNKWFGGDISGVYGVLGLKAPEPPTRAARLVPEDPDAFATRLYERLRGERYRLPPSWKEDEEERALWNNFTGLASLCVDYLQLEEALGEPPPLKTFGRSKFAYRADVLSSDPDEAWGVYSNAVHATLSAQASEGSDSSNPVTGHGDAPAAETANAATGPVVQVSAPAGWHPDPHGQHRWRWWDGQRWTQHVSN